MTISVRRRHRCRHRRRARNSEEYTKWNGENNFRSSMIWAPFILHTFMVAVLRMCALWKCMWIVDGNGVCIFVSTVVDFQFGFFLVHIGKCGVVRIQAKSSFCYCCCCWQRSVVVVEVRTSMDCVVHILSLIHLFLASNRITYSLYMLSLHAHFATAIAHFFTFIRFSIDAMNGKS